MLKEPNIFCPVCGERTMIMDWFEIEPGDGIGYSNCPKHGSVDFKYKNGKIEAQLAKEEDDYDPVELWFQNMKEYNQEIEEYLMDLDLRF